LGSVGEIYQLFFEFHPSGGIPKKSAGFSGMAHAHPFFLDLGFLRRKHLLTPWTDGGHQVPVPHTGG